MLLSHRKVVPADPSSADTAETRRMLYFLEEGGSLNCKKNINMQDEDD